LNILFGLFAVKNMTVTMEERGTRTRPGVAARTFFADNPYGRLKGIVSAAKYREIIEPAVKEGGQEWFSIFNPGEDFHEEDPTSTSTPRKLLRVWTRRRTWDM